MRDILKKRHTGQVKRSDLVQALVDNTDPETGEHLLDDVAIAHMVLFLVAGSETTSNVRKMCWHCRRMRNAEHEP